MKQNILVILLLLFCGSLSAQKVVRDSIRSGNKAFEEKRFESAASNYKSAIARDPSSKEAIFNLANTYYKQSMWDEAIQEYQRYLNVENQNPANMSAAWHNMGNSFLKKKDLQTSMQAYKQALRLNPSDHNTRYNLAVVQKMIQDQEGGDGEDQNQDQDQQEQDKQEQDQNQDQQNQDNQDNKQQENKPEENKEDQVSRENAEQILQAIEQDEKETQERVKRMKAEERKKQNENNRKQNKDW